ncbi:hypothetical protein N658DRAFT_491132 [Parathielavia hyrcaniae]|uniref:Uncharacterized protein n=1 Tax=Parathielavia hyrcaniae TaxID=113614 RepID=A0AAN6QBH3_9PEZI|nr:hypothetical protein N658DRAFT_491132 [Parathielavia hyrcaniae]
MFDDTRTAQIHVGVLSCPLSQLPLARQQALRAKNWEPESTSTQAQRSKTVALAPPTSLKTAISPSRWGRKLHSRRRLNGARSAGELGQGRLIYYSRQPRV